MPHLAQVNVAKMRAPLDAPQMLEFAAGFDPVNRLADRAPGFVWRLQTGGHAPLVEDDTGLWVVNVSLWTSYEALHDFAYRSPHAAFLRRRSRWFEPAPPPMAALWWVAEDERPDVPAARARLTHLRRYGPTPRAFSTQRRFDERGVPVRGVPARAR
ncbi:DUF3291 domain-containing protein [Blastococcus sp. SYSU D00669]